MTQTLNYLPYGEDWVDIQNNLDTEVFTIAVGSWIAQYPQAVGLIVEEFKLGDATYEVKTAYHWDIGQKWQ